MKYEIHYIPVAHVIFYDIFNESERKILLNQFENLDSYFHVGVYNRTDEVGVFLDIKKNRNFWPYFNRDLKESDIIIDIIENLVWSNQMRNIYHEVNDSLFSFFHFVNSSQILISKYGKNSFYDWHRDLTKSLTLNFWLSKDVVLGGDFELQFKDMTKKIKYRDNTLIAFPSECMHRVTEIENECTRYSIQYFTEFIPTKYDNPSL